MSSHAVPTRQGRIEDTRRAIVQRTRGQAHGAITRLFSPGDLGGLIKPFVFLDFFDADPAGVPKFGFHPHSGIATLTLILSGQASYRETTEREGVIETGGVEWMRASGGVWHTGGMAGTERVKGFQLWVALPAALELAETDSQYLDASAFQSAGPARVIAGEYEGVKSVLRVPAGMNYLDVRLRAGERWVYQPPENHDVAWMASHQGILSMPALVGAGEVAVFEEGRAPIEFEAVTDTGFVLGSAVKHPHALVTGHYSVHTTEAALAEGERNIVTIGRRLNEQGVLGPRGRGG